jgi:steroid delta-isomerase-like uncharacterized protein
MRDQIERLYRAMNEDDLDALDALFAVDYVDHTQGYRGVTALKEQLALFRRAFPDLHITVDDTVEQGDRIASRTTVTGTQTGELMDLPATGRTVSVSAVDIARFEDGMAVERWGGLDMYSLLAQLGALPTPQTA